LVMQHANKSDIISLYVFMFLLNRHYIIGFVKLVFKFCSNSSISSKNKNGLFVYKVDKVLC